MGGVLNSCAMDEPRNVGKIGFLDMLWMLTGYQISRLVKFYDAGEKHFNIELDDLKKRWPPLGSEWAGNDDYVNDYIGAYSLERDELTELLVMKRNFSIVGLFTVFEGFLRKTLEHFHGSNREMVNRIRRMRLDEMKKEFAKVGVPIASPDRDWQAILGMKEVRNCVTHAGGRPDKETEKTLVNYQVPVDHSRLMILELVLAEGYFAESVDVVERTCKRIAKDCQDALGEVRVFLE